MKKQILFFVGLVLVLGVMIFFYLSVSEPKIDTAVVDRVENFRSISSDDGRAELLVPDSALPEGVTLEDISIVSADAKEFFGDYKRGSRVFVYDLKPDGLEFIVPVTINITFEKWGYNTGIIPLFLHQTGTTTEAISNLSVKIDEVNRKITVAGEINHFSKVGLDSDGGLFYYEITSGGKTSPGKSLPFQVRIWPESQYLYTNPYWSKNYFRMAPETRWEVSGKKPLTINDKYFTPGSTDIPSGDLKFEDTYDFSTEHQCIKEGSVNMDNVEFSIAYRKISQTIKYVSGRGDIEETKFIGGKANISIYPNTYSCEEKKGGMAPIESGVYMMCDNGKQLYYFPKKDPITGKNIKDDMGREIDRETGKPVSCD